MRRVYLNGQFLGEKPALVSAFDMGFNFGAGVYEVIRVFHGAPFLPERHFLRLEASCGAIGLPVPVSFAELLSIFKQLTENMAREDGIFYIQVTFGERPLRSHKIPETIKPSLLVSYQESPPHHPHWKEGLKLLSRADDRWGHCNVKSLNLLPGMLAINDAWKRGYDEVCYHHKGMVLEGASTNLFFIKNSTILTAPLSGKILAGITRGVILEIARGLELPCEERALQSGDLSLCQEAFVTSTTKGILPVASIDNFHFPERAITNRLQQVFIGFIQNYLKNTR